MEQHNMNGFLAYIMPVSGGPVDPGFGVPGWPSHPIAPGGPNPPVDPGYGVPGWPAHPIAPGGRPPTISGGPGSLPPWVMPPIAPGGPGAPGSPPGIWGGTPPNYVDIGGPAPQPSPEHPIVLPPGTPKPPLGIWSDPILPPHVSGGPGSLPPWVMPPIYIWGDPIKPAEPPAIIDWHAAWTEKTGWFVVGIPNVPAPAPSGQQQQK
jgi:hypothetical protein